MADDPDPGLASSSPNGSTSYAPNKVTEQTYSSSAGLASDALFWPAVVGIAFAAAFGPELLWMVDRWIRSEYYGHGVFVPVVSAYLMYRRRESLTSLARCGDWFGLVLIMAGLVVHLIAVFLDVNFASGFAFILTLWGLIGWVWGRAVARAALFPIAFLVFMVPVDRLLVDAFASPLQLLAAKLAAGFTHAIGMPVTREGVNVSVPQYTFEVAVPCSGLKSLTTMIALSTLYAYLVQAPWWRRVLVGLSAVPVALLANVARVALVLLVAQSLGASIAEGFFHSVSGLFVFAIGLLGLYGLGRLLGCRTLRDDI